MKKMNKLTVAALALAVISLASTAASAQTVSSPSFGDLLLGFQVSTGQGANTDLEVDLGAISNFTSAIAPIDLSSKLSVGDLTSTYSSNWASLVNWSVAGVPDANNTSFYSTSTTPIKTAKVLTGPASLIAQFASGFNGAPQAGTPTSTLVGTTAAPASGIASSYTATEGGNGYGFVQNAEQTGAGYDTLYKFVPSSGTTSGGKTVYPFAPAVGLFTLSPTGGLLFTPAAVPEPSAYALGLCAAVLFLVLRRRRMVA